MRSSLQPDALADLVLRQCTNFFPDGQTHVAADLMPSVTRALQRLEHCFSHVNNRYFFDGEQVAFNHLHGDQYAMWLYMLSRQLFEDRAPAGLCSKLFLLNKALHGCDLYFEVELPSVFLLVHPLGTVLGRGSYQDFFVAYQRCGIGSNRDVYPVLGQHVTLRPGSSILGNCVIGDNVAIAAESLVLDHSVPADSVYFGNPRGNWTRAKTSMENIWRK